MVELEGKLQFFGGAGIRFQPLVPQLSLSSYSLTSLQYK